MCRTSRGEVGREAEYLSIAIVEIKTGGELAVLLDDKSDPHWEARSQVSQKK